MRLVSEAIDRTLAASPTAPVNFGLLFNKFLLYQQNHDKLEPVVKQDRKSLISDFQKSKKQAADILKQRQLQQTAYCQAMEAASWRSFIVHARLTSPFVSGLGMAHPTETGLVLDHTSGMPYIPASSQKGVLRVAHLINTLCDNQGNWLPIDVLKEREIVNGNMEWQEDAASKTLYGTDSNKDALAGQVIVLDAYPLTPPELGEEILNPHFGDYYKGNRGPTEDQSPIPIKFLVVKKDAEFVFRLLLRDPFTKARTKEQTTLINLLEKSLHRAITEEGIGAKTALGFGRFEVIKCSEPDKIETWQQEEESKRYPWRPLAKKISAATDWGQLRQLLDNKEIKTFQSNPEITQAAQQSAHDIRDANPKKWEEDRDIFIQEWLAVSGTIWTILEKKQAEMSFHSAVALTPEEQAAIDKIKAITNWSKDLFTSLNATELPLAALKALQERMKKDWGCAENRAKPDKKQALTQIKQLIQQAQKAGAK